MEERLLKLVSMDNWDSIFAHFAGTDKKRNTMAIKWKIIKWFSV